MLNRDIIKQQNTQIMQRLSDALQKNDVEAATGALQELQHTIVQAIEFSFEQYKDCTDMNVLQSRGLRALTTEETGWYQKVIDAAKNGAKQEITNLTGAMPPTIIDRVIEDMKKEHPLLSVIKTENAAGAVKMLLNGVQMASKLGGWGVIGSAITTEISGQIKMIDVTAAKYTAYLLIPKDFTKFNFGFAPMWVDQYIRTILAECCAFGLEKAYISGDGSDQPAGMIMEMSQQTNGKYAAKTPTSITNFEDDYAAVVASLCKDDNGDYRNVPEVMLVVNPVDYIKKIRRIQNTVIYGTGVIDMISNTYPTVVVPCAHVAEGKAVAGIAANYFAAINGGASGNIEYDDSCQFLEDNRVYTTRLYGNARPVDNTSFAYLDISAVEAPALPVKVKGTVQTQAKA